MTTITVDLNELRTLLTRVLPFAEGGKYGLPVLQSVHLEGKGDYLVASATDRYIVGMSRTNVEGADGFKALVKLPDVRHILSTFKSRKGVSAKVTLAVTGETGSASLAVALADGLFADAEDLTARYSLIDGQFPAIGKVFSDWTEPTEFTGTGYNPSYLAKFAHVADGNLPIKISGGGLKPTIVQAGDYFIGAIMPVRLTDVSFADLSDWVTTLEAKPKRVRAARKAKAA